MTLPAIDRGPSAEEVARTTFAAMAVVYGFFFLLLSAIASLSGQYVAFMADPIIEATYRSAGALIFYTLILFSGLATAALGAGLYGLTEKMYLNEMLADGLLGTTGTLPLFYTAGIGFLIRMPWLLILAESIIIEAYVVYYPLRTWWRRRTERRKKENNLRAT